MKSLLFTLILKYLEVIERVRGMFNVKKTQQKKKQEEETINISHNRVKVCINKK